MIGGGDHWLHNMLGPQAYRQVAPTDGVGGYEKAFVMYCAFKAKFHGPEKRSIPVDIAKSRNIKIVQEQYGRYQSQTNL